MSGLGFLDAFQAVAVCELRPLAHTPQSLTDSCGLFSPASTISHRSEQTFNLARRRPERGVFPSPSPHRFALLLLSRLRDRFLRLPNNYSFYCDFWRVSLDAEIFYQSPQRFCHRPGLGETASRRVGRFGIENFRHLAQTGFLQMRVEA